MPERPVDPTALNKLLEMDQRLRNVERRVLLPPSDEERDLLLYENGSPLGPVDHIDFGRGATAVLVADRYARVTAPAGVGEFDAIVDGNADATDTNVAPPVFLGIGEACAFLKNEEGMQSVCILVRNKGDYSSSGLESYVETADFDCPAFVRLFGARGSKDADVDAQRETGISWQMAGFRGISDLVLTGRPHFAMSNFAEFELGVQAAQAFELLYLDNVYCDFLSVSTQWVATRVVARNCMGDLSGAINFASNAGYFTDCDFALRAGSTVTAVMAGAILEYRGRLVRASSSGTQTVAVPAEVYLELLNSTSHRSLQALSNFTISMPLGCDGYIYCHAPSLRPVLSAGSAVGDLEIEGSFESGSFATGANQLRVNADFTGNLTIGAPAAGGDPHYIEARSGGAVDITGPALVDVTALPTSTVILRGKGVVGDVTNRGSTLSSGVFLSGIGLDESAIRAGGDGSGTSGTAKSYDLDANSDNNFLDFAGDTTWAVAGTDNGTGNIVRVT